MAGAAWCQPKNGEEMLTEAFAFGFGAGTEPGKMFYPRGQLQRMAISRRSVTYRTAQTCIKDLRFLTPLLYFKDVSLAFMARREGLGL